MKKIYFFTIFAFLSLNLFAQQLGIWSTPIPQTDSTNFNQEAFVISTNNTSDRFLHLFYVKKATPDAVPQIWHKNITEAGAIENPLLYHEDFSYRNPRVLNAGYYYDPRYFLLFESDKDGTFNIYGMEFNAEGSWFGDTFSITSSNNPVSGMNSTTQSYWLNHLCWITDEGLTSGVIVESGDSLVIENVQVVDANPCTNPVVAGEDLAWIRGTNGYTYVSTYNYSNQHWNLPDSIPFTANTIELSLGNSHPGLDQCALSISKTDTTLFYHLQNENFVEPLYYFISADSILQPSAFTFDLIVDWFPMVFTHVGYPDGYYNIFGLSDIYGEYTQITFDTIPKQHPRLYYGRGYSYWFEVVNVWEKVFENGSALYTSTILQTIGGIDDNKENNESIDARPNPFSGDCVVTVEKATTSQPAIIFDITGRKVSTLHPDENIDGNLNYYWNPQASGVKPGIYFFKSNDQMVKLIYNN